MSEQELPHIAFGKAEKLVSFEGDEKYELDT